jgi:hypothetical protein
LSSIVAEKNAMKNVHIQMYVKCVSKSTKLANRNLMGPKMLPTIWGMNIYAHFSQQILMAEI